ncbi:MAG: prephenate dehydrogenase [Saprospiraceae bacterium]
MKEKELNVLVVGLGLIGASFAAALKVNEPGWKISGFDMLPESILFSIENKFIDKKVNKSTLKAEIAEADLVILAIPILEIIDFINSNKGQFKQGSIIIDVGSTKEIVVGHMDQLPEHLNPIGGHPMTGMKTAGVTGPSPILFEKKVFILTPSKKTSPSTINFATKLVQTIGGIPLTIDPKKHDFIVALASHLPYLLPTLMLKTAIEADESLIWEVAAGGFKSITKDAGHNVPMWEDILTTNSSSIIKSLELLENQISDLKKLLKDNNTDKLSEYLRSTKHIAT